MFSLCTKSYWTSFWPGVVHVVLDGWEMYVLTRDLRRMQPCSFPGATIQVFFCMMGLKGCRGAEPLHMGNQGFSLPFLPQTASMTWHVSPLTCDSSFSLWHKPTDTRKGTIRITQWWDALWAPLVDNSTIIWSMIKNAFLLSPDQSKPMTVLCQRRRMDCCKKPIISSYIYWNPTHLHWKLKTAILSRESFTFQFLLLCLKQITLQLEASNLCYCLLNPPSELFYHPLNSAAPHPGSALGLEADPARRGWATCATQQWVGK